MCVLDAEMTTPWLDGVVDCVTWYQPCMLHAENQCVFYLDIVSRNSCFYFVNWMTSINLTQADCNPWQYAC